MYILSSVLILTGCPWYHCGLNFSSLLRVKDAFLLGSYILLSIIPWDSGYRPCNWEYTLLQRYKEKEPSTYINRCPLDKYVQWIIYMWLPLYQYLKSTNLTASPTIATEPYLPILNCFSVRFKAKKRYARNLLWDQTERRRLSSHICFIFSTNDKATTSAEPPSHGQKQDFKGELHISRGKPLHKQ